MRFPQKIVEIGESQGNFRMESGSRRKGAFRERGKRALVIVL